MSSGNQSTNDIAITGMAGRFPGSESLDGFWRNLRDGVASVSLFTDEELAAQGVTGATLRDPHYVKAGAILDQIEYFDAAFFGFSPREAELTDPQHRIFLECAWEALESAGCDPETYPGVIGLYAGASLSTYLLSVIQARLGFASPVDNIPVLIGNDKDYLTTRIAYKLNLRGPCVGVQTACSSSLVAVHLACQSLLNGECDMALAGGVTVRVPQVTGYFYQEGGYLSPAGQCRAFDAAAQGTIFGNGAGLVVLKRLADALAEGDRIDAVIKGTAINNDGARKVGFTAPSVQGQVKVIAEALAVAGVTADTISYIEAHGTGTPLGDPIEIEALTRAFRAHTDKQAFCAIGSVKTNIGHLESAAGIAGLIKTALALKHRQLPPSLHYEQPNPGIDFANSPLFVNTTLSAWRTGDQPRRAGVSSFGIGGTNAHVILEESPATMSPDGDDDEVRAYLLPLSARSKQSLRALAQAYQKFLGDEADQSHHALKDICFTASLRRRTHEHRLALVGPTPQALAESLEAFLRGEQPPGVSAGNAGRTRRTRLVFVFPGQGPQWWGMGRQLLKDEPVFLATLEECDRWLSRHARWSLIEELSASEESSRLDADNIEITQVSLFAIQVALSALWQSWGITPEAVVGHSMGEVAAAHVAGALSLEEAMRVIFMRSHLLQSATQQGAMAMVELSPPELERFIGEHQEHLSIAACNAPQTTVLSGDAQALDEVLQRLTAEEIFFRKIRTTGVAGHSPQVESIRRELVRALAGLHPSPTTVKMVSSVEGTTVAGEKLNADYWGANLREPVRFAAAMNHLAHDEYDAYLEISAHPVLTTAIAQCLSQAGPERPVLASLRRQEDEYTQLLGALGTLYAAGATINWKALYPVAGRCLELPSYAWQRERYWIDAPDQPDAEPRRTNTVERRERVTGRALLGQHLASSIHPSTHFWETELSAATLPWLNDHRVDGMMLFPATAALELALAAVQELFGAGRCRLAEVEFRQALLIPDGGTRRIQMVISPASDETFTFRISSLNDSEKVQPATWMLHAQGLIQMDQQATSVTPELITPDHLAGRCGHIVSGAEHYQRMERRGVQYGPAFRGIEGLRLGDGESVAHLRLPEEVRRAAGYQFHPALLDACFQTLAATLLPESPGAADDIYLPVALQELKFYGGIENELWAHVVVRSENGAHEGPPGGDIFLRDELGRLVLEARGLRVQRLEARAPRRAPQTFRSWLYQAKWQRPEHAPEPRALDARPPATPGRWLIFADRGGVGEALKSLLEQQGGSCLMVHRAGAPVASGTEDYWLEPEAESDYQDLLRGILNDAHTPCRGIVHLWSLDVAPAAELTNEALDSAQDLGCVSVLRLVRALSELSLAAPPRLWLLTRGVHRVEDTDAAEAIASAPLWGLGKVIAYEHAELRCVRVDLSATTTADELQRLAEELWRDGAEEEMALRGAARYAARLVHETTERAPREPQLPYQTVPHELFQAGGSYLISGGLGGLGLAVARTLVEGGARFVALVGRSAASVEAQRHLEAMRQSGAQVELFKADVSEREELAAVCRELNREWPALRGVVHAAGILDDGLLAGLRTESLKAVLAPKVQGAWNLHVLTLGQPLDFFVCFSSVASLLGSPGQGSHSAANAFLDALAHYRQACGLPALSINWGAWAEAGRAAEAGVAAQLAARGMMGMPLAEGLAAFTWLLKQPTAQTGVINFDFQQWCRAYPSAARSLYLSQLAQEEVQAPRRSRPQDGLREALLAARPGAQRRALLVSHIQEQAGQVLRLSPSKIAPDLPWQDFGLDSLRSLELRNRLAASTQLTLSATMVWKYPNANALASHLAEQLEASRPAATMPRAASRPSEDECTANLVSLEQLSEAAAEAMLVRKLATINEKG